MDALGIDTGYQIMQIVLFLSLGTVFVVLLGMAIRRWLRQRS